MFYFLTLTQGRYRYVVQASLELVPTPSPPESASRDYGKIIACELDAPFKGLVVMNDSRQGLCLRAASGTAGG